MRERERREREREREKRERDWVSYGMYLCLLIDFSVLYVFGLYVFTRLARAHEQRIYVGIGL